MNINNFGISLMNINVIKAFHPLMFAIVHPQIFVTKVFQSVFVVQVTHPYTSVVTVLDPKTNTVKVLHQ